MPNLTLQLPPGLNRGASPYDTANAWYDCNQVRWQAGEMQPIGGWDRLTSTPLDSAVRRIEVWRNNNKLIENQIGPY